MDRGWLSGAHETYLGLLEVSLQVDVLYWHDGHESRTRLCILTNTHRSIADATVQRAAYDRIPRVELRLAEAGFGSLELRAGLLDLRLGGGGLALGGLQRRHIRRDRRGGLITRVDEVGEFLVRFGARRD